MNKKLVHCVLVTGEVATGFYSGVQSPLTGSYHIENVHTEDGKLDDFAWAKDIRIIK